MILYIDITNYIETRAHTGIQRVVREFLVRLIDKTHDYDVEIIYFDYSIKKFIIIDKEEIKLFFRETKNYKFVNINNSIEINDIKKDNLFLDMDGAWNCKLKRLYLYKKLKSNNVKIVNFMYDLIPIILPKYSHENTVRNFTMYLYAIFQYSDIVFFDSRAAEKDFLDIKKKIGNINNISTKVVKLGSDISIDTINNIDEKESPLLKSRYILFVGTLEPRKNQALMLEAFEKLSKRYNDLNLIFIGKAGWSNDDFLNDLKNHHLLGTKVHWLQGVDDYLLKKFYKNAYICVYLSSYEGFGLPIAESLSYGNVTITSKNSSMYEVGKNYADYLIYNSLYELYESIVTYMDNPELYEYKKDHIKKNYLPYSWEQTYTGVASVLDNIYKVDFINKPEKLQFVFISIDIENLKGTIKEIDCYIGFVSSYIIVTRGDMIDDFRTIPSKNEIICVDEDTILGEYRTVFKGMDHQSKNWLLRASLLKLDILDEEFIMLDDDNRPIRDIPIEHFIDDGRYNAYYYYDLLDWHNFESDYDKGQHNTKTILDKDGYELLSYSAHKPQIIDKKIFSEVVEYYFEDALNSPIDEWSIYFNYAISNYPFLFNKKRYDTLCWPGNASDWDVKYPPIEYNFENYYNSLYVDGKFINIEKNILKDKLKIIEEENRPYIKTRELFESNKSIYKDYDMVHGVMKFVHKDGQMFCYGLPYFLEATKGVWIKIPINYKSIGFKKSDIKLMYWINNSQGAKMFVGIEDNYTDNIIDFKISCTSLNIGVYDLLIDLCVDDVPVYGDKSPYLVKLIIK